MPNSDDHPIMICQAPEGYFLSNDPDSQHGEVEAQKIVAQRYQKIYDQVMIWVDSQCSVPLKQ